MKNFIMRQFTSKKLLSVTDILKILLIFVLKCFLINFILPKKIYQTIEKKTITDNSSIFGSFFF